MASPSSNSVDRWKSLENCLQSRPIPSFPDSISNSDAHSRINALLGKDISKGRESAGVVIDGPVAASLEELLGCKPSSESRPRNVPLPDNLRSIEHNLSFRDFHLGPDPDVFLKMNEYKLRIAHLEGVVSQCHRDAAITARKHEEEVAMVETAVLHLMEVLNSREDRAVTSLVSALEDMHHSRLNPSRSNLPPAAPTLLLESVPSTPFPSSPPAATYSDVAATKSAVPSCLSARTLGPLNHYESDQRPSTQAETMRRAIHALSSARPTAARQADVLLALRAMQSRVGAIEGALAATRLEAAAAAERADAAEGKARESEAMLIASLETKDRLDASVQCAGSGTLQIEIDSGEMQQCPQCRCSVFGPLAEHPEMAQLKQQLAVTSVLLSETTAQRDADLQLVLEGEQEWREKAEQLFSEKVHLETQVENLQAQLSGNLWPPTDPDLRLGKKSKSRKDKDRASVSRRSRSSHSRSHRGRD